MSKVFLLACSLDRSVQQKKNWTLRDSNAGSLTLGQVLIRSAADYMPVKVDHNPVKHWAGGYPIVVQ
jgi:hypothetical protein